MNQVTTVTKNEVRRISIEEMRTLTPTEIACAVVGRMKEILAPVNRWGKGQLAGKKLPARLTASTLDLYTDDPEATFCLLGAKYRAIRDVTGVAADYTLSSSATLLGTGDPVVAKVDRMVNDALLGRIRATGYTVISDCNCDSCKAAAAAAAAVDKPNYDLIFCYNDDQRTEHQDVLAVIGGAQQQLCLTVTPPNAPDAPCGCD